LILQVIPVSQKVGVNIYLPDYSTWSVVGVNTNEAANCSLPTSDDTGNYVLLHNLATDTYLDSDLNGRVKASRFNSSSLSLVWKLTGQHERKQRLTNAFTNQSLASDPKANVFTSTNSSLNYYWLFEETIR
jgi:hypothetical protein